ncbi:hypothetical protein [Fimbriimonas ginsengisoli]|uniref:Uncharacterized protein n=1 Tax=Fimbriimonas ginsengisoli Gsoil 348 TaxID=661478 RepID=A0A068NZ39_FIMGI|nr:hypothetical protein [Fimbriimonas ginsengisoli]AIE87904.1 hypothetical protein OP10G_4536 [Fimbriimonas ginsengisoli Gsoil 348]
MKQVLALVAILAVTGTGLGLKGSSAHGVRPFVVNGIRWETSFATATATAAKEGKPILHLQSFGKPGDPMACTNTRTLTATLLKDPEFQAITKDAIVSWELVREAAKVTIDCGDGKVLHRTLRGNTCLYVLRPDGTVVDAFPGVYEPSRLLPELRLSLEMAKKSPEEVRAWHQSEIAKHPQPFGIGRGVAGSKAAVEAPILATPAANALVPLPTNLDPAERLFRWSAQRLFDISAQPMNPTTARGSIGAPELATPKERGQRLLQLETDENLGAVRGVIHMWLASLKQPITAPEAKRTVFETILHIDYTDPFLGLKHVELPGTD